MTGLVVIEGIDGAGTTTQARRLVERLGSRGSPVHLTREPSDNPIGRLLREFLIGGHSLPAGAAVRQETLALLFAADRLDHEQREVGPQMASGRVVVSDRWYHSSFAYQGSASSCNPPVERGWIAALNHRAIRPDLTLFLRVSPDVAAHRRVAAGRVRELFEDLDTQRRVAEEYEATIRFVVSRGERVEIIDGEATMEEVGDQIARLVDSWLESRNAGRTDRSQVDFLRRLRDSLNLRTCQGCDTIVDREDFLDVTSHCDACRAKIGLPSIVEARRAQSLCR